MVEEVLEEVMFDAEPGIMYVATEKTVRGGEPVKQRIFLSSKFSRWRTREFPSCEA